MRSSWEQLAQYVGTNYGQDISNELQSKITVILIEPVHTDDVLLKHSMRETMIRNGQMNIQMARKAQETILEAAVQARLDMEALMKLTLIIFFICFYCACTYPIIPYTQQTEREPQYPAPACTALLYLVGLLYFCVR
jgi:hypothetical protein